MPPETRQSGLLRIISFVVLVVLSIVLMAVWAREGASGPLHAVQNTFMPATGAAGGVASGLGAATGTVGDATANATADGATLSELREENAALREQLSDTEEYRQEVERLRALLDMKQVSGVTGPTARIIGRSANAWDQSIIIDLGSDDGVESGMTIMGAYGVLGHVMSTAPSTSTVRLLTDPNSGAGVMIQSTRATGIAHGSLTGMLYLEDVDEENTPVVGDVVVTSGMGGSYERGLLVGAVVSVDKTAGDAAGTIVVAPNDSAAMLEEVIVVITAPDVAAAEAAEAERAAQEAAAAKKAAEEANAEGEGEGSEDDSGDGSQDGSGYDDSSTANYDNGSE